MVGQKRISIPVILQGIPNSNGSLTVDLNRPIDSENTEVGLVNATMWKTWKNIAATYNNNEFSFSREGRAAETITIPDGQYTPGGIGDINDIIHEEMTRLGYSPVDTNYPIDIITNYATNRVEITLQPKYRIEFGNINSPSGRFAQMLGFAEGAILDNTAGLVVRKFAGITTPNMERVNMILIHINLVNSSIVNGQRSDVLYSIPPDVDPSAMIQIQPAYPCYSLCCSPEFSHIQLRLTDEQNRPIDFDNKPIALTLHLRSLV